VPSSVVAEISFLVEYFVLNPRFLLALPASLWFLYIHLSIETTPRLDFGCVAHVTTDAPGADIVVVAATGNPANH